MSSYKNKNKGERKEIQQEEIKSQQPETIKLQKTKPDINKTRTYLWNQHIYDVGTWTKAKMEREGLLDQTSWSSIVSRTPKRTSYPTTIKLHQSSSISSISENSYKPIRKKKDKVNEFLEKMKKRSKKSVPTHQRNYTKNNPNKSHQNDQSSSDSTSKKSPKASSNIEPPNKQSTIKTTSTTKRLKIFSEIYTPTKQDTNLIGIQTESNDSPNETAQPSQLSSLNINQSSNQTKGLRRVGSQKKQTTKDLPNKPKQSKMTGFGFKCARKNPTHQNDIPIITNRTIQPTLESLQKSQTNEYFGDRLTTKPNENLRILSLNINGLDLGKGEHSLLQLCLNLQDKGVDLLCLTETNVNWKRQHLVQRFSSTLKKAWINQKISICTSDSSLSWNSNYKPGGTAIIALGKYLLRSSPKEKTHTD